MQGILQDNWALRRGLAVLYDSQQLLTYARRMDNVEEPLYDVSYNGVVPGGFRHSTGLWGLPLSCHTLQIMI